MSGKEYWKPSGSAGRPGGREPIVDAALVIVSPIGVLRSNHAASKTPIFLPPLPDPGSGSNKHARRGRGSEASAGSYGRDPKLRPRKHRNNKIRPHGVLSVWSHRGTAQKSCRERGGRALCRRSHDLAILTESMSRIHRRTASPGGSVAAFPVRCGPSTEQLADCAAPSQSGRSGSFRPELLWRIWSMDDGRTGHQPAVRSCSVREVAWSLTCPTAAIPASPPYLLS